MYNSATQGVDMPISRKVIVECPKCGYTKIVTRGDSLPDKSMFQKCPKCGEMMRDSGRGVDDVNGVLDAVLGLFGKRQGIIK